MKQNNIEKINDIIDHAVDVYWHADGSFEQTIDYIRTNIASYLNESDSECKLNNETDPALIGEIQTSFICNVEVVKNNPNYDKNGNLKIFSQDSDGAKSAEIILQEQKDKFPYNWGRNAEHMAAYVPNEIALKAMHEFAAQSRPQLTDEEIYDEVVVRYDGTKEHDMLRKLRFIDGAKWARTKLTGK